MVNFRILICYKFATENTVLVRKIRSSGILVGFKVFDQPLVNTLEN